MLSYTLSWHQSSILEEAQNGKTKPHFLVRCVGVAKQDEDILEAAGSFNEGECPCIMQPKARDKLAEEREAHEKAPRGYQCPSVPVLEL